MKKECIKECVIDGLHFIPGLEYEVERNSVDGKLYIDNVVKGYTTISIKELNNYFM